MFKKFQQVVSYVKNRNTQIIDHFAQFTHDPGLDRNNSKYYVEMQLLAFQLSRYLKMNDDKKEHECQGNYNWTYFKENLSDDDFYVLGRRILGSMTQSQWLKAIEDWSFDQSTEYAVNVINDKAAMVDSDIGDTFMKIIYKPKNAVEQNRIVRKVDVAKAMTEINLRVEVEYIKTEVQEYKEK